MYTLIFWCMIKKSKYRIRKNELRKFEKENKLTKKEKERLHWWVDAGNSAYDLRWLYELREEEELDEDFFFAAASSAALLARRMAAAAASLVRTSLTFSSETKLRSLSAA